MRFLALAVVALLLSGCSDADPPADDAAGAPTGPTDGLDAAPVADESAPAASPLSSVPVRLDGNLGTWFYACEYQTSGACQGQTVTAGDASFPVEKPGATLVAAVLTLTWTSTSPATDTLGLGLRASGGQEPFFHNVEGTSPLTINVTDLDLPLDEENRVQVHAYNVRGLVHEEPVVGYATVDQAFTIEGALTMRTPA